jgi:outer membrane protein assembly factor BamB
MPMEKLSKFVVVALITLCLASFTQAASGDWTGFRHDLNRSGYVDGGGKANSAIQIWNYSTSAAVWSSPAVVDGRVVVGCKDCHIYCLNASDGRLLWSFPTGHEVNSSPAIVDDLAYVGCDDGWFYCMNITSGMPIWIDKLGGLIRSSPAVISGCVYVGSGLHDLYCLNATNGDVIWTFPTTQRVDSSPAVLEGVVYFACDEFLVRAVNASTGQEIWCQHTGSNLNSPCLSNGYLYIGSYEGYFWALNASTGAKVWRFDTQDTVTSSAAAAYGLVYVGSEDGNLYCLNATTGKQVWKVQTGYWVWSSPAVFDGNVYVGSEDYNIYCVDAFSGVTKWVYATGNIIDSSPSILDGVLYVGSHDYHVYALKLSDSAPEQATPVSVGVSPGTVLFDSLAVIVLATTVLAILHNFRVMKKKEGAAGQIPKRDAANSASFFASHVNLITAIVIAVFTVVAFLSLASGPLWAADEKTYSQMAYHMVKSGDYLYPSSCGEPAIWAGKPPLLMWLMSLSYQIFGVNNFAARFWMPIFGALSLIVVFYLGKKLYSAEVGFLSVVVLGTFTTFFAFASHAMTDGPLLFFILASIYCLLLSQEQNSRGNWYGVLAGVLFGLALMTKQIEALLIPLIIILYFALSKKSLRFLFTKRFIFFWTVALLIFVPYVVYMQLRFPKDFWGCYFEYSIFSRAVSSIEGHTGGVLFYFNYLAINDNPLWIFLLPFAGGLCVFKAFVKRSKADLLIFLWGGVVVVIFTLAQTKLYGYILPALPAFAIGIGSFLFDLSKRIERYRNKHKPLTSN